MSALFAAESAKHWKTTCLAYGSSRLIAERTEIKPCAITFFVQISNVDLGTKILLISAISAKVNHRRNIF
jgi:hypothetical protein